MIAALAVAALAQDFEPVPPVFEAIHDARDHSDGTRLRVVHRGRSLYLVTVPTTVVRFAGRPGAWSVADLVPGDRVRVKLTPVPAYGIARLDVLTPRDPDAALRLACERSVIGFRADPWPPPRSVPADLVAELGAAGYERREWASYTLVLRGVASLRPLAWGERHPDPEIRLRATLALPPALGVDVDYEPLPSTAGRGWY